MIDSLRNIFHIPDLRRRVLFMFGLLAVSVAFAMALVRLRRDMPVRRGAKILGELP